MLDSLYFKILEHVSHLWSVLVFLKKKVAANGSTRLLSGRWLIFLSMFPFLFCIVTKLYLDMWMTSYLHFFIWQSSCPWNVSMPPPCSPSASWWLEAGFGRNPTSIIQVTRCLRKDGAGVGAWMFEWPSWAEQLTLPRSSTLELLWDRGIKSFSLRIASHLLVTAA